VCILRLRWLNQPHKERYLEAATALDRAGSSKDSVECVVVLDGFVCLSDAGKNGSQCECLLYNAISLRFEDSRLRMISFDFKMDGCVTIFYFFCYGC
jgi:hypothetical protein